MQLCYTIIKPALGARELLFLAISYIYIYSLEVPLHLNMLNLHHILGIHPVTPRYLYSIDKRRPNFEDIV